MFRTLVVFLVVSTFVLGAPVQERETRLPKRSPEVLAQRPVPPCPPFCAKEQVVKKGAQKKRAVKKAELAKSA